MHEHASPDEASLDLLRYMHSRLALQNVQLPLDINPISLAAQFLEGDISFAEYKSASTDMLAACWQHLGDNNLLRDLRTNAAVSVRLAICLLSATHGADLDEQREWFHDVLLASTVD